MEELVKQLMLANAQARQEQAQAQARQEQVLAQTVAAQQEMNRLLIEQIAGLQNAVTQQVTLVRSDPTVQRDPRKAVQRSLQKMTATDSIEAYLALFEKVAAREGLPDKDWADVLAPFLTADPQQAYYDLSPESARDYKTLKAEILARMGVTATLRASRIHDWRFMKNKPARAQLYQLLNMFKSWLKPEEKTPMQIVEKVALDRFLQGLPRELHRWVAQSEPQTLDEMAAAVERYDCAERFREGSSASRDVHTNLRRGSVNRTVPAPIPITRKIPAPSPTENRQGGPREIRCWSCHQVGHLAAHCPNREEPMECDMGRRRSMYAHALCATTTLKPHECVVRVNGQEMVALLDSGSVVTLLRADGVHRKLVPREQVGVICVHGDVKNYPVAWVSLCTPAGNTSLKVGIVPGLKHDLLMGRDCPMFWDLYGQGVKSSGMSPQNQGSPKGEKEDLVTKGQHQVAEPDKSDIGPLEVFAGVEVEGTSSEPEVSDLGGSREDFLTAQMRDPTLIPAREQVSVLNGEPQHPGADEKFPHFSVKNDLLYRVTRVHEEILEQLVVPKPFRLKVLNLAHNHVLGGHLGAAKTQERVLHRFYWPGVFREVKDFCESCPTCQKTAPTPHFRNPLVPLPIIEVPFERIAMDLVGPLPKSARGHQYILVVLDYATRYPEAVPLRNCSSKVIARELFQMFVRTGLPVEILTDQGTPFMSKIMKELCKLFKIKQLRTSVYHPQTDGLVERFNKTLKGMLKRAVEKDGRDWDWLLPPLLFAIREVPQASTGFSPFELVYGRQPRGLLDIVKETWEQEVSPYKSVVEHITQLQDRITKVMPLVREHLQAAQNAQSRIYNRAAKVREFKPGDRVLILVPTVESKFLAKWQGPFEIVERVGKVNYRVYQPTKRKPYQLYHVNLIKPWKEREVFTASLNVPDDPDLQIKKVGVAEDLSPSQKQDAWEFLQRNRDIFSELPGLTTVIEHRIVTNPGTRVNLKPYRIPEARRGIVSAELRTMLDLGVIEESSSSWSSPIVLVPKPNGTWRFCNDFRKLNEVSNPDAYPMPRVDELIERLGPARYITTLDLTKGYWQIPLSPEAKEKTAFATPEGLWQYTRMPFGLHGAPATFQRAMDLILRPHKEFSEAYLDDIVIFSKDWESHLLKVQRVLDALRRAGFTVNPEKSQVGLREARYLGYVVGRGVIKPQLNKVEAIQEWPRPLTKKQVRSFLGMVGYYRRFVPNFASLATPLTDLTKGRNGTVVKWSTETEAAFQKLKQALCQEPVLVAPNFQNEFLVQTDASMLGLGAVLSQMVGGEEHPVVYLSRKLTPAEKNYSIVERECLAIKWALETLRYYLLGRPFTLVSDHAPLTWMAQNKERNSRITRWFLSLQDFQFKVVHRPGKIHQNADALSRVYCHFVKGGVQTPGLEQEGGICRGSPWNRSRRGLIEEGRYFPFRPGYLAGALD